MRAPGGELTSHLGCSRLPCCAWARAAVEASRRAVAAKRLIMTEEPPGRWNGRKAKPDAALSRSHRQARTRTRARVFDEERIRFGQRAATCCALGMQVLWGGPSPLGPRYSAQSSNARLSSSSQGAAVPSLGARQSPRGLSAPPAE